MVNSSIGYCWMDNFNQIKKQEQAKENPGTFTGFRPGE